MPEATKTLPRIQMSRTTLSTHGPGHHRSTHQDHDAVPPRPSARERLEARWTVARERLQRLMHTRGPHVDGARADFERIWSDIRREAFALAREAS